MASVFRRQPGPIRVLHIVDGLNRGGIETWLMYMLRTADPAQFRMDFLVPRARTYDYSAEVATHGGRIIPCYHPKVPPLFLWMFRQVNQFYGPYDIVHSHITHFLSGFMLYTATRVGVPVRIAHSHNDYRWREQQGNLFTRGYVRLMRRWIHHYKTVGLAASRSAAASLFGPGWDTDPATYVHFCSLDLHAFRAPPDPLEVRAELGIPADAFVLGHVGRFQSQKNHAFLVDIAAAVARHEPRTHLLLVGNGPLVPEIRARVVQQGLEGRTTFAGVRGDVPRLMQGAMDVFVFPSHFEGLGLVGVEAQSANLPLVMSDVVPQELDVVSSLIHRLSLGQSAEAWASVILDQRARSDKMTRSVALAHMEASQFNIKNNWPHLAAHYYEALQTIHPADRFL